MALLILIALLKPLLPSAISTATDLHNVGDRLHATSASCQGLAHDADGLQTAADAHLSAIDDESDSEDALSTVDEAAMLQTRTRLHSVQPHHHAEAKVTSSQVPDCDVAHFKCPDGQEAWWHCHKAAEVDSIIKTGLNCKFFSDNSRWGAGLYLAKVNDTSAWELKSYGVDVERCGAWCFPKEIGKRYNELYDKSYNMESIEMGYQQACCSKTPCCDSPGYKQCTHKLQEEMHAHVMQFPSTKDPQHRHLLFISSRHYGCMNGTDNGNNDKFVEFLAKLANSTPDIVKYPRCVSKYNAKLEPGAVAENRCFIKRGGSQSKSDISVLTKKTTLIKLPPPISKHQGRSPAQPPSPLVVMLAASMGVFMTVTWVIRFCHNTAKYGDVSVPFLASTSRPSKKSRFWGHAFASDAG